MKHVEIFTDGACRGNPGPGGLGALLSFGTIEISLHGGETTDSQYVRKGITEWLAGWKRNGWRTASKQPVKNADLWQRLDELNQRHKVEWHWVKGHSGHRENELADLLANRGIDEFSH